MDFSGHFGLNPERNKKVFELILRGRSYAEAAAELGISKGSVAAVVRDYKHNVPEYDWLNPFRNRRRQRVRRF